MGINKNNGNLNRQTSPKSHPPQKSLIIWWLCKSWTPESTGLYGPS